MNQKETCHKKCVSTQHNGVAKKTKEKNVLSSNISISVGLKVIHLGPLKINWFPTRSAPTSYKWSYNPYKWHCKWVCLWLFHPTYRGYFIPFTTGRGPPCTRINHLSHEKNPPTFHYTGWLIGILIMVYYNPNITG